MKKIYIIQKLVVAESLEDAIKKESKFKVSTAWLDDHSFREEKEGLIKNSR